MTCLAAAALLLTDAGCGEPAAGPAAGAPAASGPAPAKVSVVQPERRSIRRVVEEPGTVEAYEETVLYAKVSGYVDKVHADIGKAVAAGEVLAEISVPEMDEEAKEKEALVRQAEADAEQARKALAAADAAVAVADASVTEARAGVARAQALYDRWASEAERMNRLAAGKILDEQSREETGNQFRAAGAAREEARAHVTSAEAAARKSKADRGKAAADVTSAEARVAVARAASARVKALLGYTKIRAPYAGVVTRRGVVNTGDLLRPDAGKAEGVFTVARLDPVRVVVEVPEADAELVREGARVDLTVPSATDAVLPKELKVARTSWALRPGSRTLRAEVDLPNPGPDRRLRPGMYVYARIHAELPASWAVPAAAVARQGDAATCFLVRDGKVVRTPVRLGRGDGQFAELLRKGRPGSPDSWEEITGAEAFATPAAGLTDGQPVEASAGK
jgi:multidrug efflux pump subunit AcrA (membrane-fusion protein)